MEKVFGTISTLFALPALFIGWLLIHLGSFLQILGLYILPAIAIIFGIIGIVKDDSKRMGVAGLILGIIAIPVTYFLGGIFFMAFLH